MERTPRDHINGNAPAAGLQPEPFSILDPATGKHRAVREMTDPEIARHLLQASQEGAAHNNDMTAAINRVLAVAQMAAVLSYEQNRRRIALTITTELPA